MKKTDKEKIELSGKRQLKTNSKDDFGYEKVSQKILVKSNTKSLYSVSYINSILKEVKKGLVTLLTQINNFVNETKEEFKSEETRYDYLALFILLGLIIVSFLIYNLL